MNILYLGDIMGNPGIEVVKRELAKIRQAEQVDLVIAQAENVSDGKSMTPDDMSMLRSVGVDFFTGGNHTPKREELRQYLEDNNQPVVGPANMPDCPGKGWKYINTPKGQVLIISLLGQIVGNSQPDTDNPLQTIDKILQENNGVERVATVVNFHGDYSSEKRVIGYYLDGRVTAVIGDHWHVPTFDAMVLPKGTAHITDVGMCGTLHSSLGVELTSIITRWRDGQPTKNSIDTSNPRQLNSVIISVDTSTGLAKSISQIQRII